MKRKRSIYRKRRYHRRNKQHRQRRRKRLQKGGIIPALIPLIAAGITAAGGIGASAAHAAITNAGMRQ